MYKKVYKVYYVIIPLLILGVSFGFTSFPITLAALIPLLFCTDRHSVGFYLLMYGGPMGGVIRTMYPSVPVYGLLLAFIGLLLMWDMVVSLFRRNLKAMWGLLLVLLVFGVFYLIGPKDQFAQNKYTTMVIHGLMMVFGYYAFIHSPKINSEGLTQLLIMSALCMFAFCISKYNFKVGGLTDYNWFREQSMQHVGKWATEDRMLVGYQHIGMLVLFGVAIYLSQVKLPVNNAIFYSLCGFQLAMVSGCRQAIFGLLVVLVLRSVYFREKRLHQKHIIGKSLWLGLITLLLLGALLFIMGYLSSDAVTSTLSEGDTGRQLLFVEALTIFQNNPLTGAGIGGFNAITGDEWPHNIFMELLCETGIIGTSLLIFIVILTLYNRKAGLLYITSTGQYYFLFLMSLFVRVLVSSDLTESIELFSAIFALSSVSVVVQKTGKP